MNGTWAPISGSAARAGSFGWAAEAVYNVIPDYEGQFGFSALGSATYLESYGVGGMQFRVGPMVHKKIATWNGMDANLFLALPLYFDARAGAYNFGSQLAFGSLWDVNDLHRTYVSTEAGIRLAHADSYIAVGIGFRFGELRFDKRKKGAGAIRKEDVRGSGINQNGNGNGNTNGGGDQGDFRDSDFKK